MLFGNNLISYSLMTTQPVEDALGAAADNVHALAGAGVAAINIDGEWSGSLHSFEGGDGYWLVANNDFSFSFNCGSCTDANSDDDGIARVAVDRPVLRAVPEVYSYSQSDQQSFYFVQNAIIAGEALANDDIIIAYNGDQIVGSRYWNGELTDIPAIGIGSNRSEIFAGYCEKGDKVSFKVWDESQQKLIDMETEGSLEWSNNDIVVINLTDTYLPTEVSLSNAYPNPFNPVTMLSYDVPSNMNVSMGIYDVRGRLVEELVNNMHDQGRYDIIWNADHHSSGVYMVKMTAGSTVKVQKVMLVK